MLCATAPRPRGTSLVLRTANCTTSDCRLSRVPSSQELPTGNHAGPCQAVKLAAPIDGKNKDTDTHLSRLPLTWNLARTEILHTGWAFMRMYGTVTQMTCLPAVTTHDDCADSHADKHFGSSNVAKCINSASLNPNVRTTTTRRQIQGAAE
ncbi:hypothetical protein J3458_000672 [Metarhizium acridum]|uniref:uncharacterized protein n=1 Tax=Metarhizium acridum TaxID=92637 RepID=UPI001C6ACD75|nr:hypothetical protein J3458_000672 [Metarhizium acridum]